jgi:hypothetical protein
MEGGSRVTVCVFAVSESAVKAVVFSRGGKWEPHVDMAKAC